ncbi:MAG: SAF domain-containing protein, partial [Acidimicrobiales bacterium]
MVGGLLVALSAVGIFAGYLSATADDTRLYAVATSDLAIGHRITGADLTQVRLELPPALQRLAYTRPRALEGAVVLGPVGRGELLQSS